MVPSETRLMARDMAVVIALVSLICLFGWFVTRRSRTEEYKVMCESCLQHLYTFGASYAEKSGTGEFPLGPGDRPRAHESLNRLIKFDPEGLEPKLFTCPAGEAVPAERDAG